MFKTYYKADKSDNYYPQSKKNTESIRVASIGYSKPWPNYETAVMYRPFYVLHYVKKRNRLLFGADLERAVRSSHDARRPPMV